MDHNLLAIYCNWFSNELIFSISVTIYGNELPYPGNAEKGTPSNFNVEYYHNWNLRNEKVSTTYKYKNKYQHTKKTEHSSVFHCKIIL